MPNLRIASLRLGRSTDDLSAAHIVTPRRFVSFGCRYFPPSLATLSGGYSAPTFTTAVPSASAIFDMLSRVNFPNLKTLELWYQVDDLKELPSDEHLLACLPHIFPLLRDLEVHRLVSRAVPKSRWDPVVANIQKVIARIQTLRSFSLDLDIPERSGWPALERMDAEYAHLVKYLHWVAEEIVSMVPWLQKYRSLGVIAVPGEKIRLRPHFQYPPQVSEILAGPPTTEYRFELEDD
ncbi:hypothetical protein B0H10DRAFT_2155478 [Mycena sp. CBHHK59/15]|nr:hypothetical protein B0H10DRAFT_2155478 [Mycena sp. CBHHK59/15]